MYEIVEVRVGSFECTRLIQLRSRLSRDDEVRVRVRVRVRVGVRVKSSRPPEAERKSRIEQYAFKPGRVEAITS